MKLSDYQTLTLAALLQELDDTIDDLQLNLEQRLNLALNTHLKAILQQANQLIDFTSPLGVATSRVLCSIFDQIELDQHTPQIKNAYPVAHWSNVGQEVFPISVEKVQPGGEKLLKQFRDKCLFLLDKTTSFKALYTGLLTLIDEYLWWLPFDQDNPDVPLSEMLRLNSAVAACLYQSQSPETPFVLVAGDLSGIQRYVFGITEGGKSEEGTGKRLRARSLFVQLLAEVGMQKALQIYDLPPANVLMSSGGKFHILWPYNDDNPEQLKQLQGDFDSWLHKELNGEIGLALAYTPISNQGLQKDFGKVLERVESELRQAKNRKLATQLQLEDGWIEDNFLLDVPFEGQSICRSCTKFPASDTSDFCQHCALEDKIGSRVVNTKWLALHTQQVTDNDMPVLGNYVTVLSDLDIVSSPPYLLLQLGGEAQPTPDTPALWRPPAPYVNSKLRFLPMAQKGEGRELLGYLKADVDNLGAIFQWGLKRNNGHHLDTPARLSTLSRQLDRFFSGWLSHHLQHHYQDSYTVFAGGDDLFVIGRWDLMTKLAQDLQTSFARFAGGNPDVTLSAGIAVVKPRYPLGLAARQAEDLLDEAKNHPSLERGDEGKGRNQVALLGDVLAWETYQMVLEEQEKLQTDQPTSAFLYHLLQYAEMWRKFAFEGDSSGLRFQPMLAYNITRNVDSKRQSNLKRWADRFVNLKLSDPVVKQVLNHLGVISSLVIFSKQQREE